MQNYMYAKRIFDIIFSILFIFFIFSWVSLIVIVIIKIQSRGPAFFKQERIGLKGEVFNCYKFRTMHLDETRLKNYKNDKRIFPFGKLIRKLNVDEFPQFFNVLKGDMSIVGPRPHMIIEDKDLERKIKNYCNRRLVKPGITGYAAINGFRGGTNDMVLKQKRTDLDIEYINNWSFFLDIKICLITQLNCFFKSGGHTK